MSATRPSPADTIYPPRLLETIRSAWPDKTSRPPDHHILRMLDVAYHAGLQTEEGRPLRFRLAYLNPQSPQAPESPQRLLHLASAIPLSIREVVKLAPIADPRRCAIGVFPGHDDSTLGIWGLVHSGAWESAHNQGMDDSGLGEPAPHGQIVVSCHRPGMITAGSGRTHLCTLDAGQIQATPSTIWNRGVLAQFFREICDAFRDSLKAGDVYRPSYLTNLPYLFVESLVWNVTQASHGATLVFVPEGFTSPSNPRSSELRIKYGLRDANVWDLMIRRFTLEHSYFDTREAIDFEGAQLTPEQDTELYLKGEQWRTSGAELRERSELFASLAAVDGAVVLDTRLGLLGFGAEIRSDGKDRQGRELSEVVLDGPESRRPIHEQGTRHRSAYRLCFKDDSIVCIVVSSDGGVRGVRRVGADVHVWQDL